MLILASGIQKLDLIFFHFPFVPLSSNEHYTTYKWIREMRSSLQSNMFWSKPKLYIYRVLYVHNKVDAPCFTSIILIKFILCYVQHFKVTNPQDFHQHVLDLQRLVAYESSHFNCSGLFLKLPMIRMLIKLFSICFLKLGFIIRASQLHLNSCFVIMMKS